MALLALAAPSAVLAGPVTAARASYGISTQMGVDSCGFGTASAAAFFSHTPYWIQGLYVGGSDASCPVSSSYAGTLQNQGWNFMPLWVGPQSQCFGGGGAKFSNDAGTAFAQGEAQENAASGTLKGWGWDTTNMPLVYDLEAFNTGNSACVAAARQFISGWDYEARVGVPQQSGVYGSTCASDLNAFATAGYVPNFIDGAAWDGNKATENMPCIPSGDWTDHQRFKQYAGDHNETWNGYTVNVDSDCANGPTYPGGQQLSEGCA